MAVTFPNTILSVNMAMIMTAISDGVIDAPSGTQAGDYLVAHCSYAVDMGSALVMPSGWTYVAQDSFLDPIIQMEVIVAIFYRKLNAPAPATYSGFDTTSFSGGGLQLAEVSIVRGATDFLGYDANRVTSGVNLKWDTVAENRPAGTGYLMYGLVADSTEERTGSMWSALIPAGTTRIPRSFNSTATQIGWADHTSFGHCAVGVVQSSAGSPGNFEVVATSSVPATPESPFLGYYTMWAGAVTLNALTLTNNKIADNAPIYTPIGTIQGKNINSYLYVTNAYPNSDKFNASGEEGVPDGILELTDSAPDLGLVAGQKYTVQVAEYLNGPNISRHTDFSIEVIEGYSGPKWIDTNVFNSSTAGLTSYSPSNIQMGDLLLLFVETANQAVTTPSDWTLLHQVGAGTAAASTATRLTVFYKYVTPQTVTVDAVIADPGDHLATIMHRIRGAKLNSVPTVVPTSNTTATTAHAFPAHSTAKSHTLMIAALAVVTDISTARVSAWTGGYTERSDHATTQGNGGGIAVATLECLTANTNATTTATVATSSAGARMLIAVESDKSAAIAGQTSVEYDALARALQMTSEYFSSTWYPSEGYLAAGGTVGNNIVVGGILFWGIAVPAGATIISATLVMSTVTNTVNTNPPRIYGRDLDTAPSWSSPSNLPHLGPFTSNYGVFRANPGSGRRDYDVTNVVTSIVSRSGWTSGNNIAMILGHPTQTFDFVEVDTAVEACPQLKITYSGGSAATPVVQINTVSSTWF